MKNHNASTDKGYTAKGFNYKKFLIIIVVLATIILSLHQYLLGSFYIAMEPWFMTHYNNFLIFRQSFYHLIDHQDLYQQSGFEYMDLYKYSPSFALFMGPIALLAVVPGLLAWNLVNSLVFFFGFWKLQFRNDKTKAIAFGFLFIEMITSLQNMQSNCLIAGLLLFAFFMMERRKVALAALFIVLTIFIKLFGIVALSLFLLYPQRWKALLYALVWAIIIAILPLLVVNPAHLILLYQNWLTLLVKDYAVPNSFSIYGWLNAWFNLGVSRSVVFVTGGILFIIPLIRRRLFSEVKFRLFFLASILLWVVLFNHKAESPTYIIACTGVSIWFFIQKLRVENLILLGLVFVFTVLSHTDLFPDHDFIDKYCLKAVPCILVWIKLLWDLMNPAYKTEAEVQVSG